MTPRLFLTLAVLAYGVTNSSAAIVAAGSFATGTGTLTFTTPISFTVTTAGSVNAILFGGWAASDGTFNSAFQTVGSTITYKVNGGEETTTPTISLIDHRPSNSGAIVLGDTALRITPLALQVGDVFTIVSQQLSFTSTAGFNSAITGTYSGTPFLASSSGVNLTAVPEPSSAILVAVGGLALIRRRR
jgi:PEP-CTERM putative exosortase interaction domain